MSIQIQGITFEVSAPYAEGHICTAIEAGNLNQSYTEALRNNFSKTVKAAFNGQPAVSPEVAAELQAKFAAYVESYSFKGKRISKAPLDPVEYEAAKLARAAITEALKKKGANVKDLAAGKMEGFITQLLDSKPEYRAEAQRRIDAQRSVGADALAGLGLD